MAFLVAQMIRVCLQCGRPGFNPWVGQILWRRKLLPTPVFLPGESHGEMSLAGYSPQGRKELDTTERITLSLSKGQRTWPGCCGYMPVVPNLAGNKDQFHGRQFFHRQRGGWFQDDSSALCLLGTLFLLLSHQLHLRSSGIRSGD